MVDGNVREGVIRFLYSSSSDIDAVRMHLDWVR